VPLQQLYCDNVTLISISDVIKTFFQDQDQA